MGKYIKPMHPMFVYPEITQKIIDDFSKEKPVSDEDRVTEAKLYKFASYGLEGVLFAVNFLLISEIYASTPKQRMLTAQTARKFFSELREERRSKPAWMDKYYRGSKARAINMIRNKSYAAKVTLASITVTTLMILVGKNIYDQNNIINSLESKK